ncbi:MAG: Qat anti-phage system QueC-like protein QatC [Patescibacteria group bacterium]
MRKDITITIAPEADFRKETAKLALHFDGQTENVVLDVDATALLKVSRTVPDLAQDFLCIASCVYAADKAVPRDGAEDKWTRHLAIEIPVEHVGTWTNVVNDLSDCISFLTGDRWEITFRHGEKRLVQKKPRQRSVKFKRATGEAVCLFSGGLDSFIGAVDWLTENPSEKLLLVGHYDRHVSGPGVDQRALEDAVRLKFNGRFELAQTQVGLSSGSADTNFRSRSLLFVALGCYFGELLGERIPILIPENGPIALNFPLTPARRGSCSTRTVHPHFIADLNRILERVNILNPVQNPYELKTKGEMVDECQDQTFLNDTYALSRSCAKANHREAWSDRKARSCGVCIPCLFRRASLHSSGRDDEAYGKRIEAITSLSSTPLDVLALLTFVRRNPPDREIAAGLLGNGSLPLDQLTLYVDLVKRMRAEVLTWLKASGSAYLKNEVRAC